MENSGFSRSKRSGRKDAEESLDDIPSNAYDAAMYCECNARVDSTRKGNINTELEARNDVEARI